MDLNQLPPDEQKRIARIAVSRLAIKEFFTRQGEDPERALVVNFISEDDERFNDGDAMGLLEILFLLAQEDPNFPRPLVALQVNGNIAVGWLAKPGTTAQDRRIAECGLMVTVHEAVKAKFKRFVN